jgi:hypothetical protein
LTAMPRYSRLSSARLSIPTTNPDIPGNPGARLRNAMPARAVTIISTPIRL